MKRIICRLKKLNCGKKAWVLVLLFAATAIACSAQTFTVLHSFGGADGANPGQASLVQGTDGNLYGTTVESGEGIYGTGTAFNISTSGTLTTLYNFCSLANCLDGENPQAGLIQGTDGNFYGTTAGGGDYDHGTVFKLTSTGTLTTLYSFCAQSGCADGASPYAALVEATNGNFYGTTQLGGTVNDGTIFEITSGGTLTTLHNFNAQASVYDGLYPVSGLIQATNGTLYGMAEGGGEYGAGTIYEMTLAGKFTTLHSFCPTGSQCSDGEYPTAELVQATDGNFYGTTRDGGASNGSFNGNGVIFKITPKGVLTTLYTFCPEIGCTDGSQPSAAVIQASDGNLYGTTQSGGTNDNESFCGAGCGTIFKITRAGKFTTLYSFCSQDNCADGGVSNAALVQDTSGTLYGTTSDGGSSGEAYSYGTVFSLSEGLGAFVETQPTSGKVGAAVNILGTNLAGATSVTFNGKAAVFEVVSNSLITATVPAGATTGKVKVVTPTGTLFTNVSFRIP